MHYQLKNLLYAGAKILYTQKKPIWNNVSDHAKTKCILKGIEFSIEKG